MESFLLLLLTVIASHEEATGHILRLQKDPNTEVDDGPSTQLETGSMKKGEPMSTEQKDANTESGNLLLLQRKIYPKAELKSSRIFMGINAKEGEPMSTLQNANRSIKEVKIKQSLVTAKLSLISEVRGLHHQFPTKSLLKFPNTSPLMRRRYRRSFGYKTKCIPMKMKQCRIFNVNGLLKNYCVTYSAMVCTALD